MWPLGVSTFSHSFKYYALESEAQSLFKIEASTCCLHPLQTPPPNLQPPRRWAWASSTSCTSSTQRWSSCQGCWAPTTRCRCSASSRNERWPRPRPSRYSPRIWTSRRCWGPPAWCWITLPGGHTEEFLVGVKDLVTATLRNKTVQHPTLTAGGARLLKISSTGTCRDCVTAPTFILCFSFFFKQFLF